MDIGELKEPFPQYTDISNSFLFNTAPGHA